MDPEQTFLRVHARLSGMLAQLLSPRVRGVSEHLCLLVAILLLGLLAGMHVNFVSQPGCSKELSRDNVAEGQLLQIKIVGHGLWSLNSLSGELNDMPLSENPASTTKMVADSDASVLAWRSWLHWCKSAVWQFKGWRKVVGNENEKDAVKTRANMATKPVMADSIERQTMLRRLSERWTLYGAIWLAKVGDAARRFAKFWRDAGRELLFSSAKDVAHAESQKAIDRSLVNWLEKRSDSFEPVYLYSVEKGYLILPEDAKFQHNVVTVNVSISAQNLCFGDRWQQLLINGLVGYDTILMNSLLNARGEGYLYNYQTKELYDLNYPRDSTGVPNSIEGYIVSKSGVLIMSLFVFFTTTMSVSFTLRETQSRMLQFTVQLQYHARHRLPAFRLIFVHVIESLVFVPIMIGILFFLFEFYDDQLLAFMVLTLVWLCELFTMISVRTPVSMQYFPRFFFLYFMVFHIYFFSYEYGFSYLAFSTTAAFMQHLVLYFWNRFEVPALQRFLRARMLFQQQTGVQITSSAIITSTVHVTRLAPAGTPIATEPNNRPTGHSSVNETANTIRDMGSSDAETPLSSNTAFPQALPSGDVNRLWMEHLSGVGRNYSRLNTYIQDVRRSVNENIRTTDSTPSTTSGQVLVDDSGRGNEGGSAGDGLHQRFHPSADHPLTQSASLNSFGSILLWILGGPSENLSTFLPVFRETNVESNNGSNTQTTENGRAQRSAAEAGEGTQGLRWRSRNVPETTNQEAL